MAGPSGGSAPLAFPTTDIQTVKVWSRRVEREVIPKTIFGRMIPTGIVMEKDELTRGPGDEVKITLETIVEGDGKIQNEKISTSETVGEVAPTYYQDSVVINQLRQAIRWYARVDQQRVVMNFRRSARDQLVDWWADRLDTAFLNQVTGNTALFDADPADTSADGLHPGLKHSGLNLTAAPSTNNLVDATDQKVDLGLIEDMITKAKTMKTENDQPIIRPVRIEGGEYFVVLMHSYCWRDLRRNTDAGQWLDIQKAAMAGGLVESNPIFTGAAGVYGGAIFFETSRMPGVPTDLGDGLYVANQKRIALLGQGACALAYGRDGGRAERYLWEEDKYDLGNEAVIGAALIHGLKKCRFGATGSEYDYGTIVANVFAAADPSAAPA